VPVVVLVVCGAPLTARIGDVVGALVSAGWETYVIGTPSASAWIDTDLASELEVRFDFREPGQPKSIPTPDVVAVCPATFNTVNKVVAGVADNYAVSFVCEAVGAGIPVVMAPMVNQKLWAHIQWKASLDVLRHANVRLLDPQSGDVDVKPVESGTGDAAVRAFKPSWLVSAAQAVL
jgi:phosphopantothenoylcysteine synthetase/decarboxylase